MRLLGVHALYQRPRTSQPHPAHRIYPYLLRDLPITRPNHVWCTDVTDIPLRRGFLYLVAVMDWASRKVLSWRLSNTLDASFCVEALHEALERDGPPEIFNSDQGSQIHQRRLHRRAHGGGHSHLDGRQRPLDGQRVHRAVVAIAQVRVRLPVGVRDRLPGPGPASAGGWTSTTGAGPTRRSTTGRRTRRTRTPGLARARGYGRSLVSPM